MQPSRSTSAAAKTKTNKMANNSRHSDYGEEFVERLRRDRFKKAYILVNGVSSEEEDEELDFDEEDEEVASFAAMGSLHHHQQPPPRPSSTHSSRRGPPSIAASYSNRIAPQHQGLNRGGFDARDLYFFGVISELTDKFTPERAARLINKNPPPAEFRTLVSIERIAYLLYFSLYGKYLNVAKFHNIFNREFYKYTSAGDSERNAFLKICRHTLEEYKRRLIEQNKRAYKLTQKHLFSDERATPDSRASDRPSICADESIDQESLESLPKELMFYRSPHAPVRFGPGGRIIYVQPDFGMSLVCIEDTKKFYKDMEGRRYVEMIEVFKGPMLVGHTPPQTPLLFIQRQIDRILRSDVYRANPASGDANDCLLIWHLLEMLVRQQGKVTGPDLARLLCSNQQYSSFTYKNFQKTSTTRGRPETVRQDSNESVQEMELNAMDRITRFLLGGHIEEAIESAIADGLLFDAFMLAYRLFRNDPRRLAVIEARLMSHRSPQHPITTLVSVAADLPVPLLNNPTVEDSSGWRGHIAIVLANLQTQTAMNAVYQLGLTLAKKEFNSAADFCFLAVNLLTGYNCFQKPISNEAEDQPKYRQHISLINASLPDDEFYSCNTRFGWSILDYQATEIFDYALQMANPAYQTALSNSVDYVRSRKQYMQLLNELGGFGYALELYNNFSRENPTIQPQTTPTPPNLHFQPIEASFSPPEQPQHHFQPQHSTPNEMMAFQIPPHQQRRDSISPEHRHEMTQFQQPPPPPMMKRADSISPELHLQQNQPPPPTEMSKNIQSTAPILPQFPPIYHDNREETLTPPISSSSISPADQQQPQPPPMMQMPTMMGMGGGPSAENSADFSMSSHPPMPTNKNQPQMMMPMVVPTAATMAAEIPNVSVASTKQTTKTSTKQNANNENNTAKADEKKATTANTSAARGSDGFLRSTLGGLFSKIKPQGPNQMILPPDKDPTIVWDEQLGKYVDREQKDKPQEELPPPPISMVPQPQPQQLSRDDSREERTSTPLIGHQDGGGFPPAMPDIFTVPPIPKSGGGGGGPSRPFQGRSRYANAWNS